MLRAPIPAFVLCCAVVLGCGDDSSGDGDADGGTAAGSDSADDADDDADDDGADATGAVGDDYAETVLGAMWADDMTLVVNGDTIEISSDGYPNHDVLEAYGLMDNTTIAVVESATSMSIPASPEYSETTTDTSSGSIGIAISGGVYFNPYEGDGVTVAVDNNFDVGGIPFLDSCNGHPLPDGGTYHYHGIPYCITDVVDADGAHASLIGLLLDGFAVYGPSGEGGAVPSDLDECSGHNGATPEFPDGVYHYHLTESAPYSIPCYHGVVADQGGGMMPPGGQ